VNGIDLAGGGLGLYKRWRKWGVVQVGYPGYSSGGITCEK
jgi:hypothetical protein